MDGAHKRQKRTSDLVLCDEGEAGAKRQRVQRGVAASGRRGQATLIRAAQRDAIPTEVRKEVARDVGSEPLLRYKNLCCATCRSNTLCLHCNVSHVGFITCLEFALHAPYIYKQH